MSERKREIKTQHTHRRLLDMILRLREKYFAMCGNLFIYLFFFDAELVEKFGCL